MTRLADLSARTVHRDQHRAVMRLTLRLYAETHRIFNQTYGYVKVQIDQSADSEGVVDGPALLGQLAAIEDRWRADVRSWTTLLERARAEAANIALGGLVVMHNHHLSNLEESLTAQQIGTMIRLWETRRERALSAAANRIHGDGLNLSARLWRLENGGLAQIRNTLMVAFAERTSAVGLARLLEPVLGAGQGCPRWAYRRLYDMTASERAASADGLLRGDECKATGISYNALRLARTEIQFAHNHTAMDIYQNAPWVQGYYVRLSPAHPVIDICDELAAGGPYEPTDLRIPAHPQCLCFAEPAVMPADDFRRNIRGWLNGENRFLDDYETWLGAPPANALPWTLPLADSLELWLNTSADGQAGALGL